MRPGEPLAIGVDVGSRPLGELRLLALTVPERDAMESVGNALALLEIEGDADDDTDAVGEIDPTAEREVDTLAVPDKDDAGVSDARALLESDADSVGASVGEAVCGADGLSEP